MNVVQVLNVVKKITSLLPFILAAIIGGFISGWMVKGCRRPDPVTIEVNLKTYEEDLQRIQTKQDSISNVLPTYADALRELSNRYGTHKPK